MLYRHECEKEEWREDDEFVRPTNRSSVTSKFVKCKNVIDEERREHEEKYNGSDVDKSSSATPVARRVLDLEISPMTETNSIAEALRRARSEEYFFTRQASESKQNSQSEQWHIKNKNKEEKDECSADDEEKLSLKNAIHSCGDACNSSLTPRYYNMIDNASNSKRSKSVAYSRSNNNYDHCGSHCSRYSTRCQSLPCPINLNSPHSSSLSTQIYNDYNLTETTSMSKNENSAYKHSFTHHSLSEKKRKSYCKYNTPWSVFYPNGTKDLPPIRLHYLTLKNWQTRHAKNFALSSNASTFSSINKRASTPTLLREVRIHNTDEKEYKEQSKNSKRKESCRRGRSVNAEQKVEWLHCIEPRNAFVFFVKPVQYEKGNTLTVNLPMSKENANVKYNSSSICNCTAIQNIARLWSSKSKHKVCNVPLFARRNREKRNFPSFPPFDRHNEDSYSKISYSYNNRSRSFSIASSSQRSTYVNTAHSYTNNEVQSTRSNSCCNDSEPFNLVSESYEDNCSQDCTCKNTLNKMVINKTQHVKHGSGVMKSGNRYECNMSNNVKSDPNNSNDSFSKDNVATGSFFSAAAVSTSSQIDCTNRRNDKEEEEDHGDGNNSDYCNFTPSRRTCDYSSDWDSVSNTSRGQSSFAFCNNNKSNKLYSNSNQDVDDKDDDGNAGVEAVVVLYDDVTGLDFNPRLTTSRLAIEAKHIKTFYFPSYHGALMYFQHGNTTKELSSLEEESLHRDLSHKSQEHIVNSNNRHSPCVQKPMSNSVCSNFQSVDSENSNVNDKYEKVEQETVSDGNAEENDDPVLISSHEDCMMCIYSADPHFIAVLRDIVMPFSYMTPDSESNSSNDMRDKIQARLLKYVEVGMPSWAVFVASSSLPLYTRRCRKVVVALCHLWPLISLGVGCYDLYKHLPQLKVFFASITDPLARWVEHRLPVRVSVLLTYLLSVTVTTFTSLSELFPPLLLVPQLLIRMIWNLFSILHFPIVMIISILYWISMTIVSLVQLVYLFVRLLFIGPFLLVYQLYLVVCYIIDTLFMPFLFLLRTIKQIIIFIWFSSESLTGTATAAKAAASSSSSSSSSSSLLINWMWWSLEDWMEFWTTIASPVKNAMLGVWNSITSVTDMLFRREMSIRHWINIKYELALCVLDEAKNVILYNMYWVYWFLPMRQHVFLLLLLLSAFTAVSLTWAAMFIHFNSIKTSYDNSSVTTRALNTTAAAIVSNNDTSNSCVFNRSNQTIWANQLSFDERNTQRQISITSAS